MPAMSPIFDPNSLYNRLRQRLPNPGLSGVADWLLNQIEEEEKDAALGMPGGGGGNGQEVKTRSFVFVAAPGRPRHLPDIGVHLWVEEPVGHDPERRLTLDFRLDLAAFGRRPPRCRVFLLDADCTARMWYAYRSGRGRAEQAPFEAGTPRFDWEADRLHVRLGGDLRSHTIGPAPDGCLASVHTMRMGRVLGLCDRGSLYLWGEGNSTGRSVPDPHQGVPVRCLDVFPDGERVATADYGGRVCVWRPDRKVVAEGEFSGRGGVGAIATIDDRRIAVGRHSGHVAVHRLDGRDEFECRPHAGRVLRLAARPAGDLISWGADGRLAHWRPGRDPLYGPDIPEPTAMAIDRDGVVVTGSADGRLTRWNPDRPDSRPETAFVPGESGTVHALVPLPDGRTVMLADGVPTDQDAVLLGRAGRPLLADYPGATAAAVRADGELAIGTAAGGAGLITFGLGLSAPLDVVLPACFRDDVLSRFEVSRLMATLPEVRGTGDTSGRYELTAPFPNLMADDTLNRVRSDDLRRNLVVVVALDPY